MANCNNYWAKVFMGKSSISVSEEIFTSAGKIFISGEGDWALGNNSMKFWDFPDIPNFLRS